MQKDNNLIFLHIYKTGGITLRNILKRNYNNVFTFGEDGSLNDFLDFSEESRNKIKVLQGHMKFGMHKFLKGKTGYISYIRNPVDRIISLYHHVKYSPNNDLHKMMNDYERSDIISFVENINKYSTRHGNNAQTNLIAGNNFYFADPKERLWNELIPESDLSDNEILEKAISNIENHFVFIGLLEFYDESLILLQKLLGLKSIKYVKRNKTKSYIKEEISKTEKEYIKKKNELDIKLYNRIKDEVKNSINNNIKLINSTKKKLKYYNFFYKYINLITGILKK